MINYQVSRLTEDERRLLEVASVAGGDFSAALVAAGLSRDAVEVERELEAFTRKDHTLVPSGTSERPDGTYSGSYAFRHILYQNVVYQHLAPVLALHFEQGRDFVSALRYLGQVAESSAKRHGHAEAASYLTRALGILDRIDVPDKFKLRVTVLRHRSLALRSSGDLAGSVRDLKEMHPGSKLRPRRCLAQVAVERSGGVIGAPLNHHRRIRQLIRPSADLRKVPRQFARHGLDALDDAALEIPCPEI